MRIVCLSDTHDAFRGLQVPDGDLLVHGGDLSRKGTLKEVTSSAEWLNSLPHKHKLVIAGNHDFCLEQQDPRALLGGVTYLQDDLVEIDGLRVFGSPWSPAHGQWAFQAERGEALKQLWQRIPGGTNILVTHGPPWGILDRHVSGIYLGCEELRARVREIGPRLHVFGHVHESYGTQQEADTLYVNACNCSFGYKRQQAPIVVDWNHGQPQVVTPAWRAKPAVCPFGPWDELVRRYGPPREIRYMQPTEQRLELDQGHVFWLEVLSDGFARGQVRFRPAAPADDVSDRGPDHCLRRWAFSLGVPVAPEWLEKLAANPWGQYGEVPDLPE